MAHVVHKTEGIVLGTYPVGESNALVHVFTRDLGLITASAQGIRRLQSKLRYATQLYCVSHVSFVYGKSSWRLTNAVPLHQLYYDVLDQDKRRVIAQTCALLRRLVTGEEKNNVLYDVVAQGFLFLKDAQLSPEAIRSFEFLFVLRILYQLGYVSASPGLELLAVGTAWNERVVSDMQTQRREAASTINKAILESQL